jgi:hypothetical protein
MILIRVFDYESKRSGPVEKTVENAPLSLQKKTVAPSSQNGFLPIGLKEGI